MLLSDVDILRRIGLSEGDPKRLVIEPFVDHKVREPGLGSYGLESSGFGIRLGDELGWIEPARSVVDPYDTSTFRLVTRKMVGGKYVLPSGKCVLCVSLEHVEYPCDVKANLIGKSTLARVSISLNTTMMDVAWKGRATIEVTNMAEYPVLLKAGQGIGILEFQQCITPPSRGYEGAYQQASGIQGPMGKEA